MVIKKIIFISILFSIITCKDDNRPNVFIPEGPVNIVINTDLPSNFFLKTLGSYQYHPGGSRGVIVLHNFDDNYFAIERTCSHNPDLTCSKIFVDSVNLKLRCGQFENKIWKPCCQSLFFFDGQVVQGPAIQTLRQYPIRKSGNTLIISN